MKKLLGGALGTALCAWMLSNMAFAALPGAQLRQYVAGAQKKVIVVLRDQMPSLPPMRRAMGGRSQALAVAQQRVYASLPTLQNRHITHFATINAFATSLTPDEAAALAAHPDVQAIFNDSVIALPKKPERSVAAASAISAPTDNGLCNTLEPEALQLMNAASLDSKAPQAQSLRDGNGFAITGKGVKVAFLAEGIDTNLPGFIHTDGSKVFVDYKDFSGDPASDPTPGGEAYLDSSALAAQDTPNGTVLQYDISSYVTPAHPLPKGCSIRVRGMAPGVSLVGLKVFGLAGAYTSSFVQAIEYAVNTDDVDVINESFGNSAYPSLTDSPVDLVNAAAVKAGVVITMSAGDSGTNGTLSEESERPAVIAVGASTSFRAYAQTADGIFPLLKTPAWESNNISALSSGGFTQGHPKVLDVVAPGDLGWALCSTNLAMYTDCTNNNNAATPVVVTGGTSQSSPFTAGVAALIIQAYRSVHRGQDPTPAQVKNFIMSTATDLGAPPSEQGAGLVNAYAAVNAALSAEGAHPNLHGSGLLVSPNAAGAEAEPETAQVRTFALSNYGIKALHLTPQLQTLAGQIAGESLALALKPASDRCFENAAGNQRCYITHTFKVPANADHLDASIAYPSPLDLTQATSTLVLLALIDPAGRQAAYSLPQGAGSGYGHVDVVHPQQGSWTAVIWTRAAGIAGSVDGTVKFNWHAEAFSKIGNVYPASLDIAPGASASLRVQFSMPRAAGDESAAVRFLSTAGSDAYPAIPVSLRTLVPINASGGSFEGSLTGGNGRPGSPPTQSFAFDVPAGHSDMALSLKVSDPAWLLQGVLVDPNGMPLSVNPNLDPVDGTTLGVLDVSHYSPQPGRWHFLLIDNYFSSGNQTSLPFTAQVKFDGAKILAPTLPNSAGITLSASKTTSVDVQVVNNTPLRQLYFADARLSSTSLMQLPTGSCSSTATILGACAYWQLPTQTSAASFVAQSDLPLQMDAENANGDYIAGTFSPDIFAKSVAKDTVAATLLEPELPYSYWEASPTLIGPFTASGTPTAPVTFGAFVIAKDFDAAVSADSGDLWADVVQNTTTFNPLILEPGQSGTIKLSITPDAASVGATVSGKIFIDTYNQFTTYGDEVVALPYRYTVEP